MSLAVQQAAASDALIEAMDALRKALTNARADVARADAALRELGAASAPGRLAAALAQAQQVFDSGVAVNIAATTCEHWLGVGEALRAAGRN